jgi:hypothetical protein
MLLYTLPVPSPDAEPFFSFASLNQESLLFSFRRVSRRTSNVLDLFTEVIVIRGLPHWVPAQSICIRMFQAWLMQDLEAEILQHIDPFASPAMCV